MITVTQYRVAEWKASDFGKNAKIDDVQLYTIKTTIIVEQNSCSLLLFHFFFSNQWQKIKPQTVLSDGVR